MTTVVGLTFVTVGCSSEKSSAPVETVQRKNVEVIEVKHVPLENTANLSGKLEAYEESTVSFKVGGQVLVMQANIGDQVSKGEGLASLDAADYELQQEKANKGVSQASAAIQSAVAEIQTANSRVESAKANLQQVTDGARNQEKAQAQITVDRAEVNYKKAKTDAERSQVLYEEGVVSKSENERMQQAFMNAKNDFDAAKERLSLTLEGATNAQLKAAASAVAQAESGYSSAIAAKKQATVAYQQAIVTKKEAELKLSRAVLKSPIDGVVLDKMVSSGEMINTGQAVYRLGLLEQLKVLLPVPDRDINDWEAGQKVTLLLYGQERSATVNNIYPQTNAGTGTISVEVIVPNPKQDWFPGQVVKAMLRDDINNNGILVPIQAVISNGDEPYVFKVVNGKAVKTNVETGDLFNNNIQITKGLTEGDAIVTTGADLLLDGDAVQQAGGKQK